MPSSLSPASSPTLPPDVRDLLRAFSVHDVRYLVVGAHALGYWAQPRATGDLDLFVEPSAENARRVLAALADYGAPLGDLTAADLTTPGTVFQMGDPPWRIDLNTELTGITFELAVKEPATALVDGLEIPIIGRQAMIANKRAVGRAKDLFDLALLGEG